MNLIGQTVSVFCVDNSGNEYTKEITVKDQKDINGMLVIFDTDNTAYMEDDIDLTSANTTTDIKPTPEAVLWIALKDNGIITNDDKFDADTYHNAFIEFMVGLKELGILGNIEE